MADPSPGLVPEELLGARIAQRFVVERLIGHGPLSTAFRAYDDRLHRRVTVKLFHPRHRDDVAVVEQQLEVASQVARLAHEHIALVIDRGEHDGMPLIVLEFVRGENLHERIERFAPLAVAEVVAYGLQIARALTYAHGQRVVHGNLRPENVLLTEDRDVKLVDFGGGSYVAQLVGDPYAAPELREVDALAPSEPTDDIYALGALLFTALSEHTPPAGLTAADVQAVRPDVSPRLAGAIATALATDPLDRHGSMRAFASELAAAQTVLGGITPAAADETLLATDVQARTEEFPVTTSRGERRRLAADEVEVLDGTAPMRRPRSIRRRYAGELRARLLAWSMVLVPIAALVIVGLMIAGERGSDQVNRDDPQSSNGPVRVIAPTTVRSFDPDPGDGAEREDLIGNLDDDDTSTSWQTEGYDLPDFGGPQEGAKHGVGIVLTFDSPQDVRDIGFVTNLPGWTVEVRTADTIAPTLAGWKRVSPVTRVETGVKIPVDLKGSSTRYVLLWVSRLAVDIHDANHFRARINELAVYATGTGESTSSAPTETDGDAEDSTAAQSPQFSE
ncbi:MAG: serine/threonine protein kinase [Thermoleophilia bacterium]|nr:serine/threonine protein kinase [Thermoleophilia bacterium]